MTEKKHGQTSVKSIDITSDIQLTQNQWAALRAIISGASTSYVKVFSQPREVDLASLKTLSDKLAEKFNNHDQVGVSSRAYIKLNNGRAREYSDNTEMHNADWNIPEFIRSAELSWECYFKLPNNSFPEKHTLTLRLGSSLTPPEYMQLLFSGESPEMLSQEAHPAISKIQYTNPRIADEIQLIVEEWYKSLSILETASRYSKLLRKHRHLLGQSTELLLKLIALSVTYYFLRETQLDFTNILAIGFSAFAAYLIINFSSHIVGRGIFEKIGDLEDKNVFNITAGDKNFNSKVKKNNRRIYSSTVYQIVLGVLVNIIWAFLLYIFTR